MNGTLSASQIAEILLHRLLVLDLVRQADRLGRPAQSGIILLQEAFQRIRGVPLIQSVQQDSGAVHQDPAAVRQPDDTRAAAPHGKAQRVGIRASCDHGDAGLPQPLNGADAVPADGRLLKLQALCRLLHLLLQGLFQLPAFSFQHLNALAYDLLICFRGHRSGTNAAAFFHIQLQTGPLLADIPWKLAAAGGQCKRLAQQADGHIGRPSSPIGSKVLCSVLFPPPGHRKLGIGLPADAYKGITLVIFQQDIILWFVFFDQCVFKQQGVQLR